MKFSELLINSWHEQGIDWGDFYFGCWFASNLGVIASFWCWFVEDAVAQYPA
jgi:hypothetical protein